MSGQQLITRITAICVASAIGLINPVSAAPVLSSTSIVKSSLPNETLQVRSRNRGGAIAAGAAIGMIGAIVGTAAARNQYYYGPGYYAPGYYGPGYYGPYGGSPYPYGGYYYGYGYGPSGAVVAGAVIGSVIGTAAALSQYNYRQGRYYRYPWVYDSRGYYGGRVDTNAGGSW